MKKPLSVEGHHRAIEDSFETAKNELGLDGSQRKAGYGGVRSLF